jgi:nitrogen fixation/metabolism regulation signal transduction histidine kinase
MNFLLRSLPFLAFVVLFVFALYLAGSGDQIGPAFVPGAYALVVAAGLSFGIVVGLLFKRSMGLYRDWRNAEPGAGLRLRLFALLLLLTIPPWILLGFSLRFLNTTIDSWFRVEVEQALVVASDVAKDALRAERSRSLERTSGIADGLAASEYSPTRTAMDLGAQIEEALERSGALQLNVFDDRGNALASASADTRFLLPAAPSSDDLRRASNEAFCDVEGEGSAGLTLRVLRPLSDARWLEARFATAQNWSQRASLIETQVNDYKKLKYLRNALKTTLFIVLSVVLLLGALVALYMAFAISKRVVAPLTNLVAANRRVAAGDYSARVSEGGATELSLLARSFNQMSGDLERANVQAQRSGVQAMADRSFLETVLERIRSGVLILEGEKLKSANVAAAELLEVPLSMMLGRDLTELGKSQPRLAPLTEMLLMHARTQAREWRAEIALDAALGKQLILLRGARLPDGAGGESGGQVVIADDEGDVARTQRESAWSEVARRLAHEIKNPLTPIQLAAERLRRKYLTTLPETDRDVLDRATHTIVAQVESLKTMVNAFSDYSRPPQLQMLGVDMPALAYEVAELYASESQKVSFEFDFNGVRSAPKLRADAGRLRQLLHNLIKNAQEASEGKPVNIQITAQMLTEGSNRWYELSVADNGPGLPSALRERLFEPYTTSKTKGTGLGLAIVKKIVEEHGGSVRADAKKDGGAVFRVRFPLNV